MISIPIAVNNDMFKWQLDLFWHGHLKTYGKAALHRAMPVIIKESGTPISNMPHLMADAYDTRYPHLTNRIHVPLNIQVGLSQVIDEFDNEEIIEVLDCDMFHMKPYPEYHLPEDSMIVCDVYEDWHLKSMSTHRDKIFPFVQTANYYNGGFVPIITRAKTLKKILPLWTSSHIDIIKNTPDPALQWWAGMYALQVACEVNKVQMIAKDMLYIPRANALSENHYIAHYSVDDKFNKKTIPNMKAFLNYDTGVFPDNVFYNMVKELIKIRQ